MNRLSAPEYISIYIYVRPIPRMEDDDYNVYGDLDEFDNADKLEKVQLNRKSN